MQHDSAICIPRYPNAPARSHPFSRGASERQPSPYHAVTLPSPEHHQQQQQHHTTPPLLDDVVIQVTRVRTHDVDTDIVPSPTGHQNIPVERNTYDADASLSDITCAEVEAPPLYALRQQYEGRLHAQRTYIVQTVREVKYRACRALAGVAEAQLRHRCYFLWRLFAKGAHIIVSASTTTTTTATTATSSIAATSSTATIVAEHHHHHVPPASIATQTQPKNLEVSFRAPLSHPRGRSVSSDAISAEAASPAGSLDYGTHGLSGLRQGRPGQGREGVSLSPESAASPVSFNRFLDGFDETSPSPRTSKAIATSQHSASSAVPLQPPSQIAAGQHYGTDRRDNNGGWSRYFITIARMEGDSACFVPQLETVLSVDVIKQGLADGELRFLKHLTKEETRDWELNWWAQEKAEHRERSRRRAMQL